MVSSYQRQIILAISADLGRRWTPVITRARTQRDYVTLVLRSTTLISQSSTGILLYTNPKRAVARSAIECDHQFIPQQIVCIRKYSFTPMIIVEYLCLLADTVDPRSIPALPSRWTELKGFQESRVGLRLYRLTTANGPTSQVTDPVRACPRTQSNVASSGPRTGRTPLTKRSLPPPSAPSLSTSQPAHHTNQPSCLNVSLRAEGQRQVWVTDRVRRTSGLDFII